MNLETTQFDIIRSQQLYIYKKKKTLSIIIIQVITILNIVLINFITILNIWLF
jgi:hypothetical protein